MKIVTSLFAAAVLLAAALAWGRPALAVGSITSPYVEKGELELEYSATRTQDDDGAKHNLQSHSLEMEYGLTERFAPKIEVEFENEANEGTKLRTLEASGKFQLAERGEYWLDPAVSFSYTRGLISGEADAVKGQLLLQKDSGPFLHRANVTLKQQVGRNARGGLDRDIRWGSRYLHDPRFEPGFEIQSDLGKTSDSKSFRQQEHYIGPAVYGKLMPGLKYEAAWLFGVSDGASDGAARLKIVYEIPVGE